MRCLARAESGIRQEIPSSADAGGIRWSLVCGGGLYVPGGLAVPGRGPVPPPPVCGGLGGSGLTALAPCRQAPFYLLVMPQPPV